MPSAVRGKVHNLVIAPQVYNKFPNGYSVFQVEQFTSARWLSVDYIQILSQSEYVLDYSMHNLKVMRDLGLDERRLFYCPIGIKDKDQAAQDWGARDIDFLFYGDPSSPRRKKILDKLSKHMPITICSEVFGEELETHLMRAKYVLNIHYYEKALLETTRICQSLSMGARVLTESSINDEEYCDLFNNRLVRLDLAHKDSHETLKQILNNPEWLEGYRRTEKTQGTSSGIGNCHSRDALQAYYIARFLLEANQISYEWFRQVALGSIDPDSFKMGIVLTLPESSRYTEAKLLGERLGLSLFHGAKYNPGWRGCALSYKLIGEACKSLNITTLACLEDDCEISTENYADLVQLRSKATMLGTVDMASGIISDISDCSTVEILGIENISGSLPIQINRVTSMLCNIYEDRCLELLAKWPIDSGIGSMLTIDRWLEIHNLICITSVPNLADQANNLASTIWGNHNSQQTSMIKQSKERLSKMTLEYILDKRQMGQHSPHSEAEINDKNALFILERLRELFDNYSFYGRSEERLSMNSGNRLNAQQPVLGPQAYEEALISRSRTWRASVRLKQLMPGYFLFRRIIARIYNRL
jgi:hypothetical protein